MVSVSGLAVVDAVAGIQAPFNFTIHTPVTPALLKPSKRNPMSLPEMIVPSGTSKAVLGVWAV